ncbi:amidohydrolase family protein [Demequina sp. NBRC 110051]|uniref:metal-dependent hydrolase family protein n=1 Tax=Demequina sp. NBRC 110051 TaxID=1570340 RepID=UPI000A008F27|nr:amidohydrolase family protein [Demequina sp. NBRC 110051]
MPAGILPLTPTSSTTTRVVGATILDGTLRDPIENGEVEFQDGVLTYVGPRRAQAGAGATVIDASGGYLMPGFVDLHVHLAMSHDAGLDEQRLWFPEEEALATASTMRQTLEAGVTSARDLSGLTPGYRRAIAQGRALGPRMHLAIALLSPTGGHGDPVFPNGSVPLYAERATTPGWRVVDTDDEVIRTVRTLARTGADVIKVCTTGGMSSPSYGPDEPGLPMEHVRLIVEEMARLQSQPVTAHAQGADGVTAAVVGGAASVEHGYDVTDDTLALMVEHGTAMIPTLSTLLRPADATVLGAERAALKRDWQARGVASTRRAIDAGVTIGMGTDAGIHPQGRNLTELGHLVEAGLTPLQALHAGTATGAKLMRLDDRLGTLAPGMLADMVLSDINPLERIHDLGDPQRIRAVIQGGRFVKDLDEVAPRERLPL